jgi:predicted XRE-type DNA-binding protein
MTPEGRRARIQLYKAINEALKDRGITQTEAAEVLGIRQAKISAIKMMRLDEFATDRLITFLNTLGFDVDIVVRKKPGEKKSGHLTVTRK